MFLGTDVTPFVFVEVTPMPVESSSTRAISSMPNAFVKKKLMEHNHGLWTVSKWQMSTGSGLARISRANVGVIRLPSLHPLCSEPYPFLLVGYGFPFDENQLQCLVTNATLVRILPPQKLPTLQANDFLQGAADEISTIPLCPSLIDDLCQNHGFLTLRTLSLHINTILSTPVDIGTTHDAFQIRKQKRRRSHVMEQQIRIYGGNGNAANVQNSPKKSPQLEGALIVHSPHHGAGKTLMVQLAAKELGCQIHILEAAPLLAKYGIHADAALETLIHSIITSAAVRGQRLCIVLNHLQAFAPITKTSDTSLPTLLSMSSYLFTLTKSIQQTQRVSFPNMNPFYNLGGAKGRILPIHMCIVGVVTCPDGDAIGRSQHDVLTMLQGTRYRLPDLSTQVRIRALSAQLANLTLSQDATQRLPGIVASRVGLRGRDFGRIRQTLMQISKVEITAQDLVDALSSVQPKKPAQFEVVVHADENQDKEDIFSSVGGNMEAKLALHDALAMDPQRLRIVRTFRMTPPTGVLLYGPPGTGKTLLARAVAKVIASADSGGAFFSLQASDIVRSEVGNSEKVLVAAFATARANAPSIIFIDEFQALFTERSGASGGQLASTLLHCMDDINRWEQSDDLSENESPRLVVIGATNTPWLIDKAFLRPGRFDKVVHVGLPSGQERKSILSVHIRRMRLKHKCVSWREELCMTLSVQTCGFSGADLAALCRLAGVRCLSEHGDDGFVDERHFFDALQHDVKATSNVTMVSRLKRWKP